MSRKQALQKPYFKRRQKPEPNYVREYAFEENGSPALDKNGERIWRDRPNRVMKRAAHAQIRKATK